MGVFAYGELVKALEVTHFDLLPLGFDDSPECRNYSFYQFGSLDSQLKAAFYSDLRG